MGYFSTAITAHAGPFLFCCRCYALRFAYTLHARNEGAAVTYQHIVVRRQNVMIITSKLTYTQYIRY